MLEQIIVLVQITFIDIVMAADNAIIIGMIASNFTPKNRKQIILLGVSAAFIFRFIFALSANYLFEFSFVKIIGGLLLVWIVNDLRRDLFEIKKIKSPTKVSKEPSYTQGVYKVLFADLTLSFDNVIGVVGAAKDHFYIMVFGLLLSVILVGTLASYFAKYIQNNKWIGYVGLAVIFVVALQLIIGGMNDLNILQINENFERFF